jgi:hypothetical protein
MGQQYFTGTMTQTVVLPAVSTLTIGQCFLINNLSTSNVTIETSDLTPYAVMASNQYAIVTCVSNSGTGIASWSIQRWLVGASVTVPTGFGGTGQNGALNSQGVIFANTTTMMASTAQGASGTFLGGNGSLAPAFRVLASGDIPNNAANTTGTAANITASSNSTLTTLSVLSLPGSQVTGNISGNAANVTGIVTVPNGGTGLATLTANNVILGAGTSTPTFVAPGTSGNVLTSNGTTWTSAAAAGATPTQQIFTSTSGTLAASIFQVSGITTPPTAGATYTNNSVTYTVVGITNGNSVLFVTPALSATTGSTLTKTSGTGDSTITFISTTVQTNWAPGSLGTYTAPAGVKLLKVTLSGGGGGGGGTASASVMSGAGAGGAGGGSVIKYIASPAASYFFDVGTGGSGGSAGTNSGLSGRPSSFISSNFATALYGGGGTGGNGSGAASTTEISASSSGGGGAVGGDLNVPGSSGFYGLIITTLSVASGFGGTSLLSGSAMSIQNASAAGNTGTLYGGGGSGGAQANGGGTQAGGNGAAGVVIVEEFY